MTTVTNYSFAVVHNNQTYKYEWSKLALDVKLTDLAGATPDKYIIREGLEIEKQVTCLFDCCCSKEQSHLDDLQLAKKILNSIKELSLYTDTQGLYNRAVKAFTAFYKEEIPMTTFLSSSNQSNQKTTDILSLLPSIQKTTDIQPSPSSQSNKLNNTTVSSTPSFSNTPLVNNFTSPREQTTSNVNGQSTTPTTTTTERAKSISKYRTIVEKEGTDLSLTSVTTKGNSSQKPHKPNEKDTSQESSRTYLDTPRTKNRPTPLILHRDNFTISVIAPTTEKTDSLQTNDQSKGSTS